MNRLRFVSLLSLLPFVGLFTAVVLLGGLGGCAAGGASVTSPQERYTDSDEPEARKRAGTRLRLAVLYFQDGKYNFALDEIKQTIQIDPGWYEPYGMRALIQMQAGDLAASEASFQKALSLNSQASDLKHNYGYLLCKMKRPDDAMKQFSAALADPAYGQRAKTWAEQGRCQLANEQKREAETSFMRSYELDASNPATGYSLSALLFQRGELARAQFYARRINNSERASAESLWLGIKIERSLGAIDAQSQLEAQLRRRFAQSPEAMALDRGAFNE
jgi:type IV pilus assembly protein PilF